MAEKRHFMINMPGLLGGWSNGEDLRTWRTDFYVHIEATSRPPLAKRIAIDLDPETARLFASDLLRACEEDIFTADESTITMTDNGKILHLREDED